MAKRKIKLPQMMSGKIVVTLTCALYGEKEMVKLPLDGECEEFGMDEYEALDEAVDKCGWHKLEFWPDEDSYSDTVGVICKECAEEHRGAMNGYGDFDISGDDYEIEEGGE
jgi:hypothetical protein